MEGVELQLVGERERVACHVGDRVAGVGHRRLARIPVIEDHGSVLRGGLDLGDPNERVAAEAGHTEERLALPMDLVELLSVHLCDRHARKRTGWPANLGTLGGRCLGSRW